MGVYSDFIYVTPLFDGPALQNGARRKAYRELKRLESRFDPEPDADFKERNTVYQMNEGLQTFEVCKFVFTFFKSGNVYESVPISWVDDKREVENAVDTAFSQEVPSWAKAHAVVAGSLTSSPYLSITLSGTSVQSKPWAALKIVRTTPSPVYYYDLTTTYGQPNRHAWAVMHSLGMIKEPPPWGTLPETLLTSPGENPKWPSASLRAVLAEQASIEDESVELRARLNDLFRVRR
ncbi:MAG: hypothetical protein AMS22_05140 [Thiotrichales bacterium SG8_50]|nr:MAG: hypothetical protein AMS22_05140 [Thiotrichales bacterium SG8_50]